MSQVLVVAIRDLRNAGSILVNGTKFAVVLCDAVAESEPWDVKDASYREQVTSTCNALSPVPSGQDPLFRQDYFDIVEPLTPELLKDTGEGLLVAGTAIYVSPTVMQRWEELMEERLNPPLEDPVE